MMPTSAENKAPPEKAKKKRMVKPKKEVKIKKTLIAVPNKKPSV